MVEVPPAVVHLRVRNERRRVDLSSAARVHVVLGLRVGDYLRVVLRRIRHISRKLPAENLVPRLLRLEMPRRVQIAAHRRKRRNNIVEKDKSTFINTEFGLRSTSDPEPHRPLDVKRHDDAVEVVHRSAIIDSKRNLVRSVLLNEIISPVAQERNHINLPPLSREVAIEICCYCLGSVHLVGSHRTGKAVDVSWLEPFDRVRADFHDNLVVLVVFRPTAPAINRVEVNCPNTICKARGINCRILDIAHHKLSRGAWIRTRTQT